MHIRRYAHEDYPKVLDLIRVVIMKTYPGKPHSVSNGSMNRIQTIALMIR